MNWQSSNSNPPAFNRATSQASATFDASVSRLNMLSPKKARPRHMPYRPPTSRSSSQHSTLWAYPMRCRLRLASSIGRLIQLSGRSSVASPQARSTAGKSRLAVTWNLSARMVLRSDRDRCSPSSGRMARFLGSTQKISGSSLLSAMGNIPIA